MKVLFLQWFCITGEARGALSSLSKWRQTPPVVEPTWCPTQDRLAGSRWEIWTWGRGQAKRWGPDIGPGQIRRKLQKTQCIDSPHSKYRFQSWPQIFFISYKMSQEPRPKGTFRGNIMLKTPWAWMVGITVNPACRSSEQTAWPISTHGGAGTHTMLCLGLVYFLFGVEVRCTLEKVHFLSSVCVLTMQWRGNSFIGSVNFS